MNCPSSSACSRAIASRVPAKRFLILVRKLQDCAWTKGAPWTLIFPDGRIADAGEVLEIGLKWRNEFRPELRE